MNTQSIRHRLGQRLAVGFEGETIPEEYRQLIREYQVGNVILFKRNVKSPEQTRRLCDELRALVIEETGIPPYIMVDEECGSVSRLADIGVKTPCAMAIGATGDPGNARTVARIIGRELRKLGINMNLAPVLDCLTHPDNMVCGNRCFAVSPEDVSRYGIAYIEGLKEAGVTGCGKHFPGHGDTATDSHLALPTIHKSLAELEHNELVPFRAAISAGVGAIMSAHIVFPALDSGCPATVSRPILTGLLREKLGFDGLIISDGMEMKAVFDLYGIADGTLRALKAGVDIALVCHSAEQAAEAMDGFERAYSDGVLSEENLETHYQRILRHKALLPQPLPALDNFVPEADAAACQKIMTDSIQLLHAPDGQALPRVTPDTVVFGTPGRRNAIVNDDIPYDAAKAFAQATGAVYSAAPPEGKPSSAVVMIGQHPNAASTVQAAIRLAGDGVPVTAVSLFTPTSLLPFPDSVWKLIAWQYDALAIQALVQKYYS